VERARRLVLSDDGIGVVRGRQRFVGERVGDGVDVAVDSGDAAQVGLDDFTARGDAVPDCGAELERAELPELAQCRSPAA
jgi:hypothetical protein